MISISRVSILSVLVIAGVLPAQSGRYELGRKMRAFEAAWEAHRDLDRRAAAVPEVEGAVQGFFTGQTALVAKRLDSARRKLTGETVSPVIAYYESLAWKLDSRIHDQDVANVAISFAPLYDAAAPGETSAAIEATWVFGDGKRVPATRLEHIAESGPVARYLWKTDGTAPSAGDHFLEIAVRSGADKKVVAQLGISFVKDLRPRLDAIYAARRKWAPTRKDEESAAASRPTLDGERAIAAQTLGFLAEMIEGAEAKKAAETDLPYAAFVARAEAIVKALESSQPAFDAARAGREWLRLPIGRAGIPVCVGVPPANGPRKPAPLVIALHGAGGSENLFFDGYGDGKVTKLAAERGWIVVAPRCGIFGAGASADDIVKEIGTIWPIDASRVYVVGHSMGSGQAIQMVTRAKLKVAAVALISVAGGGASKALRDLPVFIGTGDHDFSREGSRALADSLGGARKKDLLFKDYPATEHLTAVTVALEDVFRFFDAAH